MATYHSNNLKAVIDLGSNTFHLLIVKASGSAAFEEIYRKRIFVSLAEGGIEILKPASIERGLQACIFFASKLEEYNIADCIVTGTAVLRTAANRQEFILQAESILHHKIFIIDGQAEARLIFEGVKRLSRMDNTTLIMDIGGGSTELIIAQNNELVWSNSYTLGINVLHEMFHHTEPINEHDRWALHVHVRNTVKDFIDKIEMTPTVTMIGSSGSFEVFESMCGMNFSNDKTNIIPIHKAYEIIDKIVIASMDEREKMDGLPQIRARLIVVGMLLIKEILDISRVTSLIVSPYALKEGVLSRSDWFGSAGQFEMKEH